MRISLETNLDKAIQQIDAICRPDQIAFAMSKALNATATEVRDEVRRNIPGRFTLRRNWIVTGIQVKKWANKRDLEAIVWSRDRFMDLQETGGTKDPIGNYLAIPSRLVRRTPKDLVRKADKPRSLGDRASIVEYKGNKFLALKNPRKAANGQRLRFMYLLVPRASMKERLKLHDDARRVIAQRFPINLQAAIAAAMRTARRA